MIYLLRHRDAGVATDIAYASEELALADIPRRRVHWDSLHPADAWVKVVAAVFIENPSDVPPVYNAGVNMMVGSGQGTVA